MKHKHAELAIEYAQDMLNDEYPWRLWQYKNEYQPNWKECTPEMMAFYKNVEYRRKPRTILINGIEVPEGIKSEPKYGTRYYMPNLQDITDVCYSTWDGNSDDKNWLKLGIVHLNEEAAIKHAEALLSFTKLP